MPELHNWRFFRAGGFDQVLLETGEDLRNLPYLNQKLWVALSAPAKGVQFNARTLELIDTDGDGQIRVPELLAAINWTAERLKSLDILVSSADSLQLADINNTSEEGKKVLASCREILKNLGKPAAKAITLEDAIDSEKIFAGTGFNGDGVITVLSTDSEYLQGWITEVMTLAGAVRDRSGENGINNDAVETFSTWAADWHEWRAAATNAAAGLALENIEEISSLWEQLAPKIEDYFVRCRLAAFDPRAAEALNSPENELFALGTKVLTGSTEEMAALPLSLVTPRALLDLATGLNPAWQGAMTRFMNLAAKLLPADGTVLSAPQWELLKITMASLEKWWQARPLSPLGEIAAEHLAEWFDTDVAASFNELIAKDMELASEAEAITEVERLLHYVRYLYTFMNNFVAFRDFYTKNGAATFQCGTLYIDGRSCDLCVPVADPAKHAALATLSGIYLAYCDCVRQGTSEKMTIAAAITNGDSDQIIVGRNGLFYDYSGNDWDATVVRIIDHPISLRQAFWAPYKKLGRMVGEQLQKMAAARSKAAEDKAAAAVIHQLDKKPEAKPAATPPPPFDVGKFAGIFAAIGLAVGALGTALATTLTGFMKLQWWQMPLAITGLLLLISGPSMIIAWFKLRRRNLGPLLDANGWAINARAKLNIPFGASLTALAKLPAGSTQQLSDPFAEKKKPWKSVLFLLVLIVSGIIIWIKKG